ncbi:MAG: InlB B-repeat-containing protein [Clostridiales Family XIII bacterium]|jgi:uncharacterized repeat protein (TIGR02543 family)|nr:InlB B-repeat-containing protein [Clostridiales Family XIII bacterium]
MKTSVVKKHGGRRGALSAVLCALICASVLLASVFSGAGVAYAAANPPEDMTLVLYEEEDTVYIVNGGTVNHLSAQDGSWAYDPATNTLTLTDYTGYCVWAGGCETLNIRIVGTVTLYGGYDSPIAVYYGSSSPGSVAISGAADSVLYAGWPVGGYAGYEYGGAGIYADDGISISGELSVYAQGSWSGLGCWQGDVVISGNPTVNIKQTEDNPYNGGICTGEGSIAIKGGSVFIETAGDVAAISSGWDDDLDGVYDAGDYDIVGSITIENAIVSAPKGIVSRFGGTKDIDAIVDEGGGYELVGDMTVRGDMTLSDGEGNPISITVGSGQTLNVAAGATLTVPEGASVTVASGGSVGIAGALVNNGSIENSGMVALNGGTYSGSGALSGSGASNVPFTVTWDANGGSVSPQASSVNAGAAVGTMPTPTREGYAFDGWFTAAEGGTAVTAETKVTGNVTYYARWTKEIFDLDPPLARVTQIRAAQTTFYVVKKNSITIPVAYDLAEGDTAQPVLTWASSKPKVAKVDAATGKVTAVKAGTAKITVTAEGGKSKTFTVKVVAKALKAKAVVVKKPPKTLAVGKTKALKASVSPAKATGAVLTFKSSKPSVLSVDKAGKLTALKKGTAKITVKAGGKKATIEITIK